MKKKIIPISLCGLLAGGLITGIILHFWGTQKENIVNSLYPYVSQEELVETADLIALGKFTGQSEAYLLNSIDPPPPDNQGLATEIFTKYIFRSIKFSKVFPMIRTPSRSGSKAAPLKALHIPMKTTLKSKKARPI